MKAGDETIQINVDDFFGKRQEFAENATKAAVQQMTAAVVRNIGRCLLDIEKYRDAWAGEDFDSITMDFKLIVYHPSETVVKFMGPQVSWAKRTKFVDDHVDAGTLIDADQPELPFKENVDTSIEVKWDEDEWREKHRPCLASLEFFSKLLNVSVLIPPFWQSEDEKKWDSVATFFQEGVWKANESLDYDGFAQRAIAKGWIVYQLNGDMCEPSIYNFKKYGLLKSIDFENRTFSYFTPDKENEYKIRGFAEADIEDSLLDKNLITAKILKHYKILPGKVIYR